MARKAITEYDMIQNGDRVAVGVSGGKDSVALTPMALHWLRRFIGIDYEVVAITLDPCFGGVECDYSPLAELFEREGIEYVIKRTNIGRVVFDVREETNPCSLCAKMRRVLCCTAKELGCNKLALGHHKDDAVETFIMNLFDQGRIGCFSPVSYLSRKDLTVIRPLILAEEKEVKQAVRRENFPIIKSSCPVDGHTERRAKRWVRRWSTRSGTSNRRYSVPCGGRISATGKRRSGTSCECRQEKMGTSGTVGLPVFHEGPEQEPGPLGRAV